MLFSDETFEKRISFANKENKKELSKSIENHYVIIEDHENNLEQNNNHLDFSIVNNLFSGKSDEKRISTGFTENKME